MSEVTQAQQAVKDLSLDIIGLSEYDNTNAYDITSSYKSDEVYEMLSRLTVGELLIPHGQTLCDPYAPPRTKDLSFVMGELEPEHANLRGTFELFGIDEEPKEVKDWDSEVVIELWYAHSRVAQRISAYASSGLGSVTPSVERDVWAFDYAGKGYSGHLRVNSYDFTDEDVVQFVNVARKLYEAPKRD